MPYLEHSSWISSQISTYGLLEHCGKIYRREDILGGDVRTFIFIIIDELFRSDHVEELENASLL
jgi:hypothetical protein